MVKMEMTGYLVAQETILSQEGVGLTILIAGWGLM
jgi:hypothetical protein